MSDQNENNKPKKYMNKKQIKHFLLLSSSNYLANVKA